MSGKGSAPRPMSVDKKTFDENFARIFGNKSAPLQMADNEVNDYGSNKRGKESTDPTGRSERAIKQ